MLEDGGGLEVLYGEELLLEDGDGNLSVLYGEGLMLEDGGGLVVIGGEGLLLEDGDGSLSVLYGEGLLLEVGGGLSICMFDKRIFEFTKSIENFFINSFINFCTVSIPSSFPGSIFKFLKNFFNVFLFVFRRSAA
jgi:hypothetical protein